jgi:hypothetical protein
MIVSFEFGADVYVYAPSMFVLPPWMTRVGGSGRNAAACPHLKVVSDCFGGVAHRGMRVYPSASLARIAAATTPRTGGRRSMLIVGAESSLEECWL